MQTLRRQASVEHLKSVDHFSGCKKPQLREVARLTEHVKVREGKTVIKEGQYGKEFFLILSGTVEVTQMGRLVNVLGTGDFFGELATLDGGPRNATVTALSELELLIIGHREFNAMLQISHFRDALLKRMARRLQAADAQLATVLDGKRPYSP